MPRSNTLLPAGTPKTTPEALARIDAWVSSLEGLMSTLDARWQDERDYEDLDDYAAPIRKTLPAGFTLLAMQRRPFGFTFSIGTDAVYAVEMTAKHYGWTRRR